MIVVAGSIIITSGRRMEFLAASRSAMIQARSALGCKDFVVAADPIEEDRVNIYEAWESEEHLNAFRGSGPDESMNDLIVSADVYQKEVL